MRFHVLLLLPLVVSGVLCVPIQAQDRPEDVHVRPSGPTVTLVGVVRTSDTDEPLQGATIALRHAGESALVTGGISAANGRFTLRNVPVGRYDVRISFVGFAAEERLEITLSPQSSEMDLGTFRLVPETMQGEGVEVTARREAVEVKIDRTVFNVREQVTAIGGTAVEVLQDLPSIEIDLDGSISYRGNENVAIHINGRPSSLSGEALTSFLKSLSAESVDRVEIIPNPSARYEPDGMAGILNIVLAKNRSAGWNGGATVGAGTSGSFNGSANLGYQTGPFQLFTTYGYRYSTRDITGTRLRENLLQSPSVILNQSTVDEHLRQSHAWTNQAEYQAGVSTTLGLQTVLSSRSGTQDGRTTYVERISGIVEDSFARVVNGDRSDLGLDTRLTLEHGFDTDHTLTTEIRYERDWEDEDGAYAERSFDDGGVLGDVYRRDVDVTNEVEQEGTVRVDYARPVGAYEMETGYQGSLRRLDSDQTFETTRLAESVVDSERSAFGFDEQIHAAYGILSTDVGQFGLQAGVRAEQALTQFSLESTGTSFQNNYFSLFPSAFLTYRPTVGQQVRLSYSKRVNRPRLRQLNPVDNNEDPTFQRLGNPFLEPEYVHAFEIGYVQHWRALTVTTSPYFRRTVNEIAWRETFDPSGITTLTFENFDFSDSYGTEVTTALNVNQRVRGSVSVNGYRIVTDASNVDADLSNNAMAYSGRVNLTVKPLSSLDLQLSQFYRSPVDIAGGRMGSRSMTTVGARQELFGGRATVGLQARDVLGTMGFELTRRSEAFYQEMSRDWGARQLSLSFTYSFGQTSRDQTRRTRSSGGDDDFDDLQGQ